MATQTLGATTLEKTVNESPIVLLDFWAAWCGPCRWFAPIFEEASTKHPDIVFGKIDTEAERELAAALEIASIPTLMAFRDGILLYREAGALPPGALEDLITQIKALDMEKVRAEIAKHAAEHAAEGQ